MKKIVAFLLACIMVFALVSCNGSKDPCETCVDADGNKICDVCGKEIKDTETPDPGVTTTALTVADFAAAMKDMNSSRVELTLTETSALGTLTSSYKVVFGNGDLATISYTREVWDVSEDIFSNDLPAKRTEVGTVEYANGSYSGNISGAAEAVAKLSLNLTADKLAGVQINGSANKGAQLIASVSATNSASVFGVSFPSTATLSVTMKAGGQSISAFTLSYADGANQIAFSALYQ